MNRGHRSPQALPRQLAGAVILDPRGARHDHHPHQAGEDARTIQPPARVAGEVAHARLDQRRMVRLHQPALGPPPDRLGQTGADEVRNVVQSAADGAGLPVHQREAVGGVRQKEHVVEPVVTVDEGPRAAAQTAEQDRHGRPERFHERHFLLGQRARELPPHPRHVSDVDVLQREPHGGAEDVLVACQRCCARRPGIPTRCAPVRCVDARRGPYRGDRLGFARPGELVAPRLPSAATVRQILHHQHEPVRAVVELPVQNRRYRYRQSGRHALIEAVLAPVQRRAPAHAKDSPVGTRQLDHHARRTRRTAFDLHAQDPAELAHARAEILDLHSPDRHCAGAALRERLLQPLGRDRRRIVDDSSVHDAALQPCLSRTT